MEVERKELREMYLELLQKLVRMKMQSEAEASKEEDFKDLRADIKNELSELKEQIMSKCPRC